MDRQEVYKFNPKVQDYKDVRREDLVERRKSKRQDFLDQRRDYTEETKENQGDSQAGIPKGKQTRSVLLQKWKEEHRKNVEKKVKKPFVVGVVRHNAASPMLRPIVPLPPLREVRRTSKAQVIRPQDTPTPATTHHQNAVVYCFGRQKPTEHKFEVSNSVKKLTVPVAPACMNPSRRGNLTSKQKPEASGVSAVKQNPIATQKKTAKENTAPVEKRLTRAMTAAKGTGQQKKSPTKKTVAIKVNEPSTSKANASSRKPRELPESNTSKLRRSSRKTRVEFEEDHDTNEMKTPEKRRIKQKIVPTPAVLRDSNKEPSTSKLRISSRKTRVAIFVDDHDNEEIKTPQVSRSMKNRVRTPAVKSNEDEEALEAMETDSNECAVNSTKGAQEFYGNLERESDLLLKCCDRWSKPAFTELVPQEVSDEIDSTVGQARLLVSDKFQQFKHLIQRFEEGSQPPVTAQDLHGFWDMIYIQVDKMKERFDQLTELKNCNWQKKTEQVVAKKRVASKPKAVKPVVKSRFQEFMAKKKMKNTKKSCDSQNVTPNKESQSNTDTPTGTPLLDRVKHLAVDKKSERRRSSLASASRVLRTSLIAKTLATPTPFTGNTTGGDIDQQ